MKEKRISYTEKQIEKIAQSINQLQLSPSGNINNAIVISEMLKILNQGESLEENSCEEKSSVKEG